MSDQHKHSHKITLGRPMSRFPGDTMRYRTSSYQERARVRAALGKGATQLRAAGYPRLANQVRWVIQREWTQTDPPFVAYVTNAEWKALSRALRSDAYRLSGAARERALRLGTGELGSVYSLLVRRKEY